MKKKINYIRFLLLLFIPLFVLVGAFYYESKPQVLSDQIIGASPSPIEVTPFECAFSDPSGSPKPYVISNIVCATLALIIPSPSPIPSLSPTPSPVAYGIPYGGFHFGQVTSDYASNITPAYNGSFIDLFGNSGNVLSATTMLSDAKAHNMRVVVNMVAADPCKHWDGVNSSAITTGLIADATPLVPIVSTYIKNGTVIGVQNLNEPHNPTTCTALPQQPLYNFNVQLRALFAAQGILSLRMGFDAPPTWFWNGSSPPLNSDLTQTQKTDGTINEIFLQWTPQSGSCGTTTADKIEKWLAGSCPGINPKLRDAVTGMGMKALYSVNSRKVADLKTVIDANIAECGQSDALMVNWYSWGDGYITSAKTLLSTLTATDFIPALTVCNQHM